jgi:hypothetical protein
MGRLVFFAGGALLNRVMEQKLLKDDKTCI